MKIDGTLWPATASRFCGLSTVRGLGRKPILRPPVDAAISDGVRREIVDDPSASGPYRIASQNKKNWEKRE